MSYFSWDAIFEILNTFFFLIISFYYYLLIYLYNFSILCLKTNNHNKFI